MLVCSSFLAVAEISNRLASKSFIRDLHKNEFEWYLWANKI